MTVVSNGQLWMFTLALLIFWIIVLTTAFNDISNTKNNKVALTQINDQDEVKNTGICKNLCMHCGCLGFFCGEECICECNDDKADTECIRKIQISAQSSNLSFEVLIQGPTANNFLRNALFYEQNPVRKRYEYRNKRSSVTVYKPRQEILNKQNSSSTFTEFLKLTESDKNRHKRSCTINEHLEWLNNLGILLPPAPMVGHKRQRVTPNTDFTSFGNSAFLDNSRNVVTPRPLHKRQRFPLSPQTDDENCCDSSIETYNSQEYKDDCSSEEKNIDYKFSKKLKHKKSNKKKLFSPKREKDPVESQENFINSLYKRLFKSNSNKINKILSDDRNQEKLSGLLTDHSNHFEDDEIGLFSEEVEEEKKPKRKVHKKNIGDLFIPQNDLTTTLRNLPDDLPRLRLPWLRPGGILETLIQILNP